MENISNPSDKEFRFFLLFWAGQVQSLMGSNIIRFVIIWWIVLEYESAFLLALAAFMGFAPQIIITPFAGVLADRWNRKHIIGTVDFLQAVVTTVLIYLFWTGEVAIWHVLIILMLRSVFQAFHFPAVQAIVPLLVPRDKLSRVNGMDYFSRGAIGVAGPLLAAVLLAIWKIHVILWIDAITFIIAVLPLLVIKIPSVTKERKKSSFKKDFSEGVGFIKQRSGLLSLLSIFTAANFFIIPLYVLLPLFVTQTHAGGVNDYAFLLALQQAGMLTGALFMSFWKGFKRKVVGVGFGILLMYAGFLITISIPPSPFAFLLMGLGLIVVGFGLPVANVSSQTIWQSIVPPEKIGRVFAARRSIAQFTVPTAMIMSGILAELLGLETVLFACAALGLTCLAYTWLATDLSVVEKPIEQIESPGLPPQPIAESD
ncbi:MAG: MFS transporter [Candidatus Hodarchaeales archaeon]|jgi:DHA3 family macrolide efflux protein-like MFS transporter